MTRARKFTRKKRKRIHLSRENVRLRNTVAYGKAESTQQNNSKHHGGIPIEEQWFDAIASPMRGSSEMPEDELTVVSLTTGLVFMWGGVENLNF